MLRMYQRLMFGPIRHPENRGLIDLTMREWVTVLPLLVLAVGMGIFPQPFLDRIEPSSQRFVQRLTRGPVPVPEMPLGGAAVPGPAAVAPASAVAKPSQADAFGFPVREPLLDPLSFRKLPARIPAGQ
jgi:NADH-quinone oxidoreductase subunit M